MQQRSFAHCAAARCERYRTDISRRQTNLDRIVQNRRRAEATCYTARMHASRRASSLLLFSLVIATPFVATAKPRKGQGGQPDRTGERDNRGNNERDHRDAPVVVRPTAAPPTAPRETWRPRRGQLWVAGQWQWQDNQWQWAAGHSERRRKNQTWNDGRWENRGDHWAWQVGTWSAASTKPTQPPAFVEEIPQRRRGYAWVKGNWNWDNNGWEWTPGTLQKRPAGKRWNDGVWASVGSEWQWTGGGWVDAPNVQPQPPQPLEEIRLFARGKVWVAGRWQWDDNDYQWIAGSLQPRPRGKRWQDGKWQNAGGQWSWSAGLFSDAPSIQPAPPQPFVENPINRPGYIWINGNYEWRNGDYEWMPGHWERQRTNKTWIAGNWNNNGGTWSWAAGAWR